MLGEEIGGSANLISHEVPQQGERRSVFQQLRDRLQNDPRVFFAGEFRRLRSFEIGTMIDWDLLISPAESTWDASAINAFASDVFADFQPTGGEKARGYEGGRIQVGEVEFTEDMGRLHVATTKIVTTDDPELQEVIKGVYEQTQEWDGAVRRRTIVRIYPDPQTAATITAYKQAVGEDFEKDLSFYWSEKTVKPDTAHILQQYLNGEIATTQTYASLLGISLK